VETGEDAVSLVGEARNVAVRLEDVAEPGQIVITAATHRLIRGHFDCTSLGYRKVKGVSQPVELFLVQGLGEDLNPIEVAERAGLTPLTGRDHEISLLKDRWEQAQEGMAKVGLLIGESGRGKSRWCTRSSSMSGTGRTGETAPTRRRPASRPHTAHPSSNGVVRLTTRTAASTRSATSSSGFSASAATSRLPTGSTGWSAT
jgi:hypothetical protein